MRRGGAHSLPRRSPVQTQETALHCSNLELQQAITKAETADRQAKAARTIEASTSSNRRLPQKMLACTAVLPSAHRMSHVSCSVMVVNRTQQMKDVDRSCLQRMD